MGNEQLWNRLLTTIQSRINRQNFDVWFAQLKLLEVGSAEVYLEVPSSHFQEWIRDNYEGLILSELERLSGQRFNLVFLQAGSPAAQQFLQRQELPTGQPSNGSAQHAPHMAGPSDHGHSPSMGVLNGASNGVSNGVHGNVASNGVEDTRPGLMHAGGDGNPRPDAASQPPVSTFSLNPDKTFATFVVGSSNQFAHAAAMAVADNPAKTYNPLFLFGQVGLGKTHLLNAIGNKILQDNPRARVIYLSSEQFVNELINSIGEQRMNEFRNKYRDNCDALLVDDIQFLAGKVRTQEEFFYTFNALHSSGKQIVVTSDKFPKEIQGLEERLRNRFEWGLIADIQPPDLETKVAILKRKASRDGIVIPDDVAMYIASNSKSNIRELEGILIRLTAAASFYRKPVDLAFTQTTLRDLLETAQKSVNIESIQDAVCRHFDIKLADLKGQRKNKQLVWPRQLAMYLCRKHTSSSFPEIGQKFGSRDHTTVIYAVKKVEEALSKDEEAILQVRSIEKSLGL